MGIGGAPKSAADTPTDDMYARTLYAEHRGALLRYALRLTSGNLDQAEDAVQETIVRAWRHYRKTGVAPVSSWLYVVLRNLIVDISRRQKSRPIIDWSCNLELLPSISNDDIGAFIDSDAAIKLLGILKHDRRMVILLTVYYGYTIAAAAELLGISDGTVKSRMYRGLAQLRDILEQRDIFASSA